MPRLPRCGARQRHGGLREPHAATPTLQKLRLIVEQAPALQDPEATDPQSGLYARAVRPLSTVRMWRSAAR